MGDVRRFGQLAKLGIVRGGYLDFQPVRHTGHVVVVHCCSNLQAGRGDMSGTPESGTWITTRLCWLNLKTGSDLLICKCPRQDSKPRHGPATADTLQESPCRRVADCRARPKSSEQVLVSKQAFQRAAATRLTRVVRSGLRVDAHAGQPRGDPMRFPSTSSRCLSKVHQMDRRVMQETYRPRFVPRDRSPARLDAPTRCPHRNRLPAARRPRH
jgi:hypothetical protein